MDRWLALRTFVSVVECGSLSAAARSLGVGQPAVSKTIAALERELGCPLLHRTARRVVLTDAGTRYYESIRPALDTLEEAEQHVRGATAGLTGRLRVAAPVTFGRLQIVPSLGTFLAAHPRLDVELVLDDRPIRLVEEQVDVALRMGTIRDGRLVARRLATGPRLVVAAPAYLARRAAPATPQDLRAHDVIVYDPTGEGPADCRFRRGSATTTVQPRGRLTITAAEGVRAAVLAGLGLAIASRWMFAPELRSGRVLPVLTDYELEPIDVWAVLPHRRAPARARAFIDFAQRLLVEPPR